LPEVTAFQIDAAAILRLGEQRESDVPSLLENAGTDIYL